MGVTDIRILKRELRDECKKARRDMPLSHKAQKDEMIFKRLTALPEVQSAKLILTYVSTPIEVSTFRLIDTMLRAGKAVAVPLRRRHRSDGFLSNSLYAGLRAGNLFGIGTEARYLQKSNRLFGFSLYYSGAVF